MKVIDVLAAFHNWVSDKDFVWWPFSFLRPPRHEEITFKTASIMGCCFGGLTFIFFTVFSLVNNILSPGNLMMMFLSCFGGFFLWFHTITRPLWNRRARRLKNPRG